MKEVTLTVNKQLVYNEVAKTTSYTGAKLVSDEDSTAYERIFTTDEDRLLLERFFMEAANNITKEIPTSTLKSVSQHPASNGLQPDADYVVQLDMPDTFPDQIKGTIEGTMFSFFVAFIISKWYDNQEKKEAATYADQAASWLASFSVLLQRRVKPVNRPMRPKW